MQTIRNPAYWPEPVRALGSRARHSRPYVWLSYRFVTPRDVLLAAYPRSGSHFLAFLLFECMTGYPTDFETMHRYVDTIEKDTLRRISTCCRPN